MRNDRGSNPVGSVRDFFEIAHFPDDLPLVSLAGVPSGPLISNTKQAMGLQN